MRKEEWIRFNKTAYSGCGASRKKHGSAASQWYRLPFSPPGSVLASAAYAAEVATGNPHRPGALCAGNR